MLLFVLNLIALKIATDASLKHKNIFGPIIVQALKEQIGISRDLSTKSLVAYLFFSKKNNLKILPTN